MFKNKGFYLFVSLLLSSICQPVWSREDTWNELKDTRYKAQDHEAHSSVHLSEGDAQEGTMDERREPELAQNNAPQADTNTVKKDSCYAQGKEVMDASIPCCQDLEVLTEVDTNRKFCDIKPGASSAWWIWGMVLIFPLFLLVFIIFGIRNRMALRKNQNPQ